MQRIAESGKMISCKECKERLYPDDPSIPIGKYHHSTCVYFCNKPDYYQEIEQPKSEIQPVFKPRPVDKEIDQLKAGFLYLQNKFNEHLDKSKKRDRI